MENQILSFARLGYFIRKYLIDFRKNIIMSCLGIIGAVIAVILLFTYSTSDYAKPFNVIDPGWRYELKIFCIMFSIWACLFGTKMYAVLASKDMRIAYLTSPASNLEKFLTTFLIYIIGYSLVAILGFFLADWLRVVLVPVFHPGARALPMSLEYFMTFGHPAVSYAGLSPEFSEMSRQTGIVMFAIWIICTLVGQAFFTLGSSVWPKNTIIKAGCAAIAINIISVYFYWLGYKTFISGSTYIHIRSIFEDLSFNTVLTLMYVSCAIIIIFTYWLSYKRFKEIETINRW